MSPSSFVAIVSDIISRRTLLSYGNPERNILYATVLTTCAFPLLLLRFWLWQCRFLLRSLFLCPCVPASTTLRDALSLFSSKSTSMPIASYRAHQRPPLVSLILGPSLTNSRRRSNSTLPHVRAQPSARVGCVHVSTSIPAYTLACLLTWDACSYVHLPALTFRLDQCRWIDPVITLLETRL